MLMEVPVATRLARNKMYHDLSVAEMDVISAKVKISRALEYSFNVYKHDASMSHAEK